MEKMEFNIASFTEFKDSYKKEVIQNNIGKTKHEIDVILEEMYIAHINRELNINVSTLKDANYRRIAAYQKEYHAANKDKLAAQRNEYRAANKDKINKRRRELYAKRREERIMNDINLNDYILNKNEYFTIHYNDYKDGYYQDDQIKARLRHDWKEYLRDIFGIDNSKSKDYVYSCYRRWYARERARLLKLCKGDSKLLKELMKMRHEAILAAYESKGYKLHDCSSPSYRNNREAKIEYAIEYYEDNIHKIRTRLRNKYKSGSYEKRRYDRR